MPSSFDPNAELSVNERTPRLSRSPQPYHRWSEQHEARHGSHEHGYLPSPDPTPSHSDAEDGAPIKRSQKSSPEESGNEIDDEGIRHVRALPAPPVRPKKGLRRVNDLAPDGDVTPLLTPSQLHEDGRRLSKSYFEIKSGSLAAHGNLDATSEIQAYLKFKKRRRAELIRRASEVLSLCSIGYIVCSGESATGEGGVWNRELSCYLAVILGSLSLYPLWLLLQPLLCESRLKLGSVEVPASFDPAPVLYPPSVPVLVALSLSRALPEAVIPNVILGLSALPSALFPESPNTSYSEFHWLFASLPLWAAKYPTHLNPLAPGLMKLNRELMTLLFPLHQTLMRPLYYLTSSSLLSSELQLLSIALINLLLFSSSPQSTILHNILWIGGFGLLLFCTHVLRWNVALERIPNWRFRRYGRIVSAAKTFVTSLNEGVNHRENNITIGSNGGFGIGIGRSVSLNVAGQEHNDYAKAANADKNSQASNRRRSRSISDVTNLNMPLTEAMDSQDEGQASSPIFNGYGTPKAPTVFGDTSYRPKRRNSLSLQGYFSMTPVQIEARKWGYALYTYGVCLFLIMIPIRLSIGSQALSGHEPFGWAIGYLFGDIPGVPEVVTYMGLEGWITLPLSSSRVVDHSQAGWVERYAFALGPGNTRLILFSYWTFVIGLGLVIVLYGLKSSVEVDTRRKVFHGMMVVMLLPSTYIEPCLLALGLALVLAVFLMLDLFRAAQLRPLSRPLAAFLTPYVDGRDLRGPVVVSHVFLLIGCAIPLWLSLAGAKRREAKASDPWRGWQLETQDVSMVAGVICVGMGDAAASLVGRRFGRHKWPWAGGKSLEGSAAFAAAVALGLMVGKAWLRAGGWSEGNLDSSGRRDELLTTTAAKATLAACGASFTEAVLTGANDNVVVPVVLWLLVRGLRV